MPLVIQKPLSHRFRSWPYMKYIKQKLEKQLLEIYELNIYKVSGHAKVVFLTCAMGFLTVSKPADDE